MLVRNISEAKAELSALIEAVLNGAEVIIAKAGKPVAHSWELVHCLPQTRNCARIGSRQLIRMFRILKLSAGRQCFSQVTNGGNVFRIRWKCD